MIIGRPGERLDGSNLFWWINQNQTNNRRCILTVLEQNSDSWQKERRQMDLAEKTEDLNDD